MVFHAKGVPISREWFFVRLKKHFFSPHPVPSLSARRWKAWLKTEKRVAAIVPFYAIWTVGQYKIAMSFCKAECLEACIFHACKRRMPPSGRLLEGITLEWLSSCFFRDARESRICGHVLWRPEISKPCGDEIDDLTEWQWSTNNSSMSM